MSRKAKSPLYTFIFTFILKIVCLCARYGVIKSISLFIFIPKHGIFLVDSFVHTPPVRFSQCRFTPNFIFTTPLIWKNHRSLRDSENHVIHTLFLPLFRITNEYTFWTHDMLLKPKWKIAKATVWKLKKSVFLLAHSIRWNFSLRKY